MKDPLYYKKNIPIFVNKTEAQIRADRYEHFFPLVQRNLILHTGDGLWGRTVYGPLRQFILEFMAGENQIILDVGCGVGRLSAEAAKSFPKSKIFGIDYSLQMLKMASRLWKNDSEIEVDGRDQGFELYTHLGQNIANLTLLQASADALPWEKNQVDVIIAAFLLDKVLDPMKVLAEFQRVLKKSGRCLVFIPFNFQKRELWNKFYPPDRFIEKCKETGFKIKNSREIKIKEPLDRHGNTIIWNATALHMEV